MKYITTPIYYVNDAPHIGHAVTTLAADVLARFWRLKGEDVFFLTGTDEHGVKIAQAAEKAGQSPQAFVDEVSAKFQLAWDELNLQPDGFIRTTDPAHEKYVQASLQKLYDTGYIYQGEYKGWYCVGCEEFKTETQIGPDNTCPIHLTPLTEVSEEAYLFKLSGFRDQLLEVIQSGQLSIQPESRRNEVLGFITKEGLKDVAVSRKNVAWGVSVPWDAAHTVYVWVDALLNYLSAAEAKDIAFEKGKKPVFPPTLQLIGKDILRFHAVIWPALLLAVGKPLPETLFVHGYFTVNGQKMSKSLGNVITPRQLIDRYGVDATRYLLLTAVPFGADGDISLERLDAIYSSNLANNLGNFTSRVIAMLLKYRQGVVPTTTFDRKSIADLLQTCDQLSQAATLNKYTDGLITHLNRLNSLIEEAKPWELAKQTQDKALDALLARLAEELFVLAILFSPILPDSSAQILASFGTSISEVDYATLETVNHTAGKTITPIAPLFPRLDA